MPRFMNAWITLCLDNIRVNWRPRQCILKRNKNIKEREKKTYNPVTFLHFTFLTACQEQIICLLCHMIGKNLTNKIYNKSCCGRRDPAASLQQSQEQRRELKNSTLHSLKFLFMWFHPISLDTLVKLD